MVALPSFVGILFVCSSPVRVPVSSAGGSTIPSRPVLSDLRVDEEMKTISLDVVWPGILGALLASPLLWVESRNSPGPLGSLAGGAGRQC